MKENSLIKNKLKIRVGHHFCWTLVQVMNHHCVSYFCSIDSATGIALYPIHLLLFSWMFILTVFRPFKQLIKPRELAKLLLSPIKQV